MEQISDLRIVTQQEIAEFVDHRDVTLIGNAEKASRSRSEFGTSGPRGIVVRMNKGIANRYADIWINNLIGGYVPAGASYRRVMRMNAEKGGSRLTMGYPHPESSDSVFLWNATEYQEAAEEIGYEQPLTGTMAVWWFTRKTNAQMFLTGFDFFTGKKKPHRCHQIEKDESFVKQQIENKRIRWLVPDVSEYFQAHSPPAHVVILGKGPSLDRYKPNGGFVIGLNETVQSFPCTMCAYIDPRQRALVIPQGVVLVRPNQRASDHDGRGYIFDRQRGCDAGHTKSTAGMVITLCGMWGVKEITFVGFDAFDGPTEKLHADCVQVLERRGNSDYGVINQSIVQALDRTKIRPLWFHRI